MKIAWIIIFALFGPCNVLARGGGTDGGGSVFYVDRRPILLDLLVANVSFRDSIPGINLRSRLGGWADFDTVVPSDQPVMEEVAKRLHRWGNGPAVLQIEKAIVATEFWSTNGTLPLPESAYFIPPHLKNAIPSEKLVTVAAYKSGSYGGAAFSAPIYNQMGLESQVGLWVHEALRTIQRAEASIDDGNEDETLTNEALQQLTAKIVFGPYSSTERLEDIPNLGRFLGHLVRAQEDHQSDFRAHCSALTRFLNELSRHKKYLRFVSQSKDDAGEICQTTPKDLDQYRSAYSKLSKTAHDTWRKVQFVDQLPTDIARQGWIINIKITNSLLTLIGDHMAETRIETFKLNWELEPIPGTSVPRLFYIKR